MWIERNELNSVNFLGYCEVLYDGGFEIKE